MISNITPELYADLRNSGLNNREIANKLGVSESTLSKKINQWIQQGFLQTYYNVYLDKLLNPIEVYVLSVSQRISIETYLYQLHPITVFYSPIPKPTYFIYRRKYDEFDEIHVNKILHESICRRICKNITKGIIEKTLEPREKFSNPNIVLEHDSSNGIELKVDEHDQYLAELFFKYFNPPVSVGNYNNYLMKSIYDLIKTDTYRNHYYRHLHNKLVKKRFVIRDVSKLHYGIIVLHTSSLIKLCELINNLWSNGLLEGVDQVNFISSDPVIALIHCWINRDRVWNHENYHELIYDTRYDIYLVKQIM